MQPLASLALLVLLLLMLVRVSVRFVLLVRTLIKSHKAHALLVQLELMLLPWVPATVGCVQLVISPQQLVQDFVLPVPLELMAFQLWGRLRVCCVACRIIRVFPQLPLAVFALAVLKLLLRDFLSALYALLEPLAG